MFGRSRCYSPSFQSPVESVVRFLGASPQPLNPSRSRPHRIGLRNYLLGSYPGGFRAEHLRSISRYFMCSFASCRSPSANQKLLRARAYQLKFSTWAENRCDVWSAGRVCPVCSCRCPARVSAITVSTVLTERTCISCGGSGLTSIFSDCPTQKFRA